MMLTSFTRYRPAVWFGCLALAVVAVEILVIRRPDFATRPVLPAAVTFDLLTVLPLLFYWQVIRPYKLPLSSLLGATGAAITLAYFLIPEPQQQYLSYTRYAGPALELAAISLAVVKLRKLRLAYATTAHTEPGMMERLEAAFEQVFGHSFSLLVSEIGMLYYALLSWRAKPEVQTTDKVFTSHRESAVEALLATAGFLSLIEMGAVHLLLTRWSPVAAGLVLMGHVYGLLFLVGHLRAVRLRPSVITEEQELVLRVGFVWQLRVPLAALVHVQQLKEAPVRNADVLNTAQLLFTAPNLLLSFAQPVKVSGPYDLQRQVRHVAVYLDHPAAFQQSLPVA
ncbi:hypothetical protein [Hymenobacter wooponensis]|uniref:Beta-carotene 15,15'-monooxygenase n=1 Tax=Hymenobacter wooponensis TaxID=1525360 RepID=A0A4Z0MF03_9BACT|nr:hypothetical protein [Hymenobacter wooponensis]TGD78323.1 hypothetical protein EU557_19635 [Hymenobacter wooponensis]